MVRNVCIRANVEETDHIIFRILRAVHVPNPEHVTFLELEPTWVGWQSDMTEIRPSQGRHTVL